LGFARLEINENGVLWGAIFLSWGLGEMGMHNAYTNHAQPVHHGKEWTFFELLPTKIPS